MVAEREAHQYRPTVANVPIGPLALFVNHMPTYGIMLLMYMLPDLVKAVRRFSA